MPSEITHTVGTAGAPSRDYSLLSSWEAAQVRNLVSADEVAIAECYNDGEMDDALDISTGWTTDATHYIKITSPEGQRHSGTINTGFHLKKASAHVIIVRRGYVTIEHLEVEVITAGTCIFGYQSEDGTVTVNNCLFESTSFAAQSILLNIIGSGTHTRDWIIQNCNFSWVGGTYFYCVSSVGNWVRNLTLSNNTITGVTKTNISFFLTCSITGNCVTSGNTISFTVSGAAARGYNLTVTGDFTSTDDSITLVAGAVSYGIFCDNVGGDVTINGTGSALIDVTYAGSYGIKIDSQADDVEIHDITVNMRGAGCYGIHSANALDVDIYDCLVNLYDGNNSYGIYLASGPDTFTCYRSRIWLESAHNIGRGISSYASVADKVYNCMIVGEFYYGIYLATNNNNHFVYNNSIYNTQRGVDGAGTITYKNNAILSTEISGDYRDYTKANANSTNNASRASSGSSYKAPGSNSIYSQDPSTTFADITPDSEDLHSHDSANTRDAGTDLSADPNISFSDDYDGDSRPIGDSWDMGADEAESAATPYSVDIDHEAEIFSPYSIDIDHQVFIAETYAVDIDHEAMISRTSDSEDIDHEAMIYEEYSVDIDHEMMIVGEYSIDIDHEVYIARPVPVPFFVVRELGVETHDYTDRIETVGIIRRYLDKSFGITQVGNISVVCENSDKKHTYLHPSGDFYPSSQYIWTWARITCGWGVELDQDSQAQFQGLIETLELTERRVCNFVIVDVIKELLDGKTANAITFDAALVASTPLESLNPIHIVEYLINEVLDVEVFDFETETFVDGADADSFDDAYSDCSAVVVNDTTWPAGSSIIEMIQGALRLVEGWIWTGGNGRIKAKVYTDDAPVGNEKYFIGSETDSSRKIMNLRLHPSRRNVVNYVQWTYGQAGNSHGPTFLPTSIAKYGYRPLELSTGWEIDTSVLSDVSNSLMTRYGEPPDMITFSTSNLYGSGDGLNAEIGEVIKVTDDGIGISNDYFRVIEKRDDLLGRKSEIVAEEYIY